MIKFPDGSHQLLEAGGGAADHAAAALDAGASVSLADAAAHLATLQPVKPGSGGRNELDVIYAQTLTWTPRATYYPGFATAAQCDAVIAAATPRIVRSAVAYKVRDFALWMPIYGTGLAS